MSSRNVRKLWTEKLSQGHLKRKNRAGLPNMMQRNYKGTVLGLDISLRGTGLAIVKFDQRIPTLVMSDRISCPAKLSFFQCIHAIFARIAEVLSQYHVDSVAIEQTIYVQNYKISHILGAAKGAAIAAIMQHTLPIVEYEPLRIKQAVTGFGRAGKEQVRKTISAILNIKNDMSYDESDAAAAAICHAWTTIND